MGKNDARTNIRYYYLAPAHRCEARAVYWL